MRCTIRERTSLAIAGGALVVLSLFGCGGGGAPPTTTAGTVQGAVVDATDTTVGIENAYCYIPVGALAGFRRQEAIGDLTDSAGNYRLEEVPVGQDLTMIVEPTDQSSVDFVRMELDIRVGAAGETVIQDVTVINAVIAEQITGFGVRPDRATMTEGATQQFEAVAVGYSGALTATWWVTGGIGTIDSNGLFTATTAGTGAVHAAVGSYTAQAIVTVLSLTGPVGEVQVSSTPAGARIYLDGADTGQDTQQDVPVGIGALAGDRQLGLTLSGYQDYDATVPVVEDRTTVVSVVLVPTDPLSGSIQVSSSPQGARILLDGADTGRVTPATVGPVPAGTHTVALQLDYHLEWSADVSVVAQSTVSVFGQLTYWGTITGSVSITSEPSGAEIFFDGQDVNQATPYVITEVAPGRHYIRLVKQGYEEWVKQVDVAPGQALLEFALLQPLAPELTTGSITVTSTPSGADIWLDGRYTGKRTAATISDVLQGVHFVQVYLAGYLPASRTFTLEAGQTVSVDFPVLEPDTATLEVTSSPSGAGIFLDARDTGLFTPARMLDIPAGRHSVRLTKPGCVDWNGEVVLNAGDTRLLEVVLNQIPAILALTANPRDVPPGGQSTVLASASDPDGDSLVFSWSASGGSIVGGGPSVSWVAPASTGAYTITLRIDDGRGGTDMESISVSVSSTEIIIRGGRRR